MTASVRNEKNSIETRREFRNGDAVGAISNDITNIIPEASKLIDTIRW